jgi:elongation of very long chain fatty acids protein 6
MIECPKNCTNYLLRYEYEHPFEVEFNYWATREFMRRNIWIPVTASVIYLITIFLAHRFMQHRAAFDLKKPLALWSAMLATVSIIGTLRGAIPELFAVINKFGLHTAICVEHNTTGVYGFWCWVFVLSKFVEVGDTMFIILRKQKLTFLHVFHHAVIINTTWLSNCFAFSIGSVFFTMNCVIHSIMYSYYTLRASGIKLPKKLSIAITSIQIMQMVFGFTVSSYALNEKIHGRYCDTNSSILVMSIVLYGALLILFANFFIRAYFGKPKSSQSNGLAKKNL